MAIAKLAGTKELKLRFEFLDVGFQASFFLPPKAAPIDICVGQGRPEELLHLAVPGTPGLVGSWACILQSSFTNLVVHDQLIIVATGKEVVAHLPDQRQVLRPPYPKGRAANAAICNLKVLV